MTTSAAADNVSPMDFNEYQDKAVSTAIYPGKGGVYGLAYVGLGLGEAGEVQGKIKKVLRDDAGELTEQARLSIAKEAGDLLWYLAALADEIGVPLEIIATINLNKLGDRAARGVLGGSGDER